MCVWMGGILWATSNPNTHIPKGECVSFLSNYSAANTSFAKGETPTTQAKQVFYHRVIYLAYKFPFL